MQFRMRVVMSTVCICESKLILIQASWMIKRYIDYDIAGIFGYTTIVPRSHSLFEAKTIHFPSSIHMKILFLIYLFLSSSIEHCKLHQSLYQSSYSPPTNHPYNQVDLIYFFFSYIYNEWSLNEIFIFIRDNYFDTFWESFFFFEKS